jgi:hypothetical protein
MYSCGSGEIRRRPSLWRISRKGGQLTVIDLLESKDVLQQIGLIQGYDEQR